MSKKEQVRNDVLKSERPYQRIHSQDVKRLQYFRAESDHDRLTTTLIGSQ